MQFTADTFSFFLLHVKNLNGFLLPANHALALLDETDGDGVGNTIGGRLIGIEHAAEQFKTPVIFLKKRAR